ncbi:hypothetical protein D3C72_1843220 [compost metagenome]
MNAQQGGYKQADTGQNGMDQIQQRSQEHEQEFKRLSHTGQESRQRNGQQHTANHWATFFRRSEVHGQCRTRQTEHHDREEA